MCSFCTACQCNINGTQPEICERTSGICFCKENVAEPDCSQCAEGYYGNPAIGEVCLQCPCPLTNNSHSPSCFIDSDDLITCDKCDPQYSGRDCGECSDGFFGDPVVRHIYNNKIIYCEERSHVKILNLIHANVT